ncbi:CocE/NonD family hydrolase [Halobacterium noricense]|uniref:CocE/NonD family hydrolase n=1 Tax=Halobacterium noricense TaxID=223182 RepID=UPI001E633D13|nr:CocE/NonD family hydrolase [Halobacterium noricense]UHH25345.1 CocE/NonD family hydrolase [Halobacterium noricense]
MSNRTRDFERRTFLALASAGLAGLAGCNQQSQPGTTTPTSQPPTTDESEETETETTTTEPYDAERDIMVEMRDGVSLATNVFTPAGEDGPFPTLLNRTPYNKADEEPIGGIRPAVDAGYAVVQQDFRGRFGSEGEFQGFDQGEDGYDTIEWITEQDWSTGDVGMYGTSFRGMATWQAIKEDPPGLVAAAPLVTPTNFYGDLQYMGGADNYGTSLAWLAANSFSQVSRLDVSEEKAGELRGELESLLTGLPESADTLPTIEQPAFDEGVGPLWQDWHEHSTYDEFWKDLDVLQHIPDISTPVVQASGWYDIFLRGNTWGFSTIEEEGTDVVRENQKLVLGPWAHTTYPSANPVGDWDFGSNAEYDIANELVLPWFDYWLQDEETGVTSMPKVQYFQMGDNEWRTADQWPPSGVTATEYHLDSGGNANSDVGGGVLTTGDPSGSARSDSYEYDPLDPVPTRGGPLHMGGTVEAGVKDQTSVEERDDVLVYTSEELTEPLSIAGDVTASLFVETTAEDTDFMVKLVDVGPDGYSANITEGALRARYRETNDQGSSHLASQFEETAFLEPGAVYELEIELRDVAHTFQSGHRIRVDVTSSNFPKQDRNPNAAVPVAEATESDMQTATQTLYHSPERPSSIMLPVHE